MKHEVAQVRDGESSQVCSKKKVNGAAQRSSTVILNRVRWGEVGTNWVLILFIKPTMAGARNSIKGNELVPF